MTKHVLVALALLAGCFDENDAASMVRAQNRPDPIQCVRNAYSGAQVTSYVCTDGRGWTWLCDSSHCVITWRPQ